MDIAGSFRRTSSAGSRLLSNAVTSSLVNVQRRVIGVVRTIPSRVRQRERAT